MSNLPFDDRELATILAALRFRQQLLTNERTFSIMRFAPDDLWPWMKIIASDNGAHEPLSGDDIDALCERLNAGEPAAPVERQPFDMTTGQPRLAVSALMIGQRVDLDGDVIADPDKYAGGNSEHPEFEFEYETVRRLTIEADDCICVEFLSGFTCGFPADHLAEVDPEQTPDDIVRARAEAAAKAWAFDPSVWFQCTLHVRVDDPATFVAHSRARYIADGCGSGADFDAGMYGADAEEDGDEFNMNYAVQMVFDPGQSPPGCTIEESECPSQGSV